MARKAGGPSAYQQRIERYLEKHPGATLAEARGHKPKPPPDTASNLTKSLFNIRQKEGNINLQVKAGKLEKDKAAEVKQELKTMARETRELYKKVIPGTSKYAKQREKVKRQYKKLVDMGIVDGEGDIDDIFYH